MVSTIRIQLQHEYQANSKPYEPEVEATLNAIKLRGGLVERGWDKTDKPGIIRHETGPELIVLGAALIELTAAIIDLVMASRKHHPETTVNVNISDPDDLRRVLATLGTGAAAPQR
jgi:hypothetical protein